MRSWVSKLSKKGSLSSFPKEFLENIQKWTFWFRHFWKRSNFDAFFRPSTLKTEMKRKKIRTQPLKKELLRLPLPSRICAMDKAPSSFIFEIQITPACASLSLSSQKEMHKKFKVFQNQFFGYLLLDFSSLLIFCFFILLFKPGWRNTCGLTNVHVIRLFLLLILRRFWVFDVWRVILEFEKK